MIFIWVRELSQNPEIFISSFPSTSPGFCQALSTRGVCAEWVNVFTKHLLVLAQQEALEGPRWATQPCPCPRVTQVMVETGMNQSHPLCNHPLWSMLQSQNTGPDLPGSDRRSPLRKQCESWGLLGEVVPPDEGKDDGGQHTWQRKLEVLRQQDHGAEQSAICRKTSVPHEQITRECIAVRPSSRSFPAHGKIPSKHFSVLLWVSSFLHWTHNTFILGKKTCL